MSRLATRFGQLKSQQRKALVSYVMAGDPHPEVTVPLLHQMVDAGVDVIELGRLKDRETPVVLMGYLNPVEVIGYEKFVAYAYECGVDGVLLVDLPPEEAQDLGQVLEKYEMDQIFLLAPTSTDERIQHVVKQASGFIYYVSLKGVTGAATLDVSEAAARIQKIKAETDVPVGVGFGISDAASAKAMGVAADAVIVGSAFVKQFATLAPEQAVIATVNKVKELRAALEPIDPMDGAYCSGHSCT